MKRLLRLTGILVCYTVYISAAHSDPLSYFTGYGGVRDLSSGNYLCNTGNVIPSASCNVSTSTIQAKTAGSGDASGLHAYASITTTNGAGQAAASAALLDNFHLGGTGMGYVTMGITTHGSASGAYPLIYGFTDLSLSGSTTRDECTFIDAGLCAVHLLVNLADNLFLHMQLIAAATINGGSATATADFSDTAFISSLTFTDLAGNPLDVPYTTDSGLTYPMPQPNGAPEPATLALLGLGLAGIAVTRRRKLN